MRANSIGIKPFDMCTTFRTNSNDFAHNTKEMETRPNDNELHNQLNDPVEWLTQKYIA